MQSKRVAVAVFVDSEKRILLQDRTSISKSGEKWGFFGGKIEEGETPEQALRREIIEELHYTLDEIVFVGETTFVLKNIQRTVQEYVFLAPMPDVEKLEVREGDGFTIVSITQARQQGMLTYDPEVLDMVESFLTSRADSTSALPSRQGS